MKRRLRAIFDHVGAVTGLVRAFERRMRGGLTILMYHRVLPDDHMDACPLPALALSRGVFREQVRWLAKFCDVLPLSEAMATRNDHRTRPLVTITFDDGYLDNHEIAVPVLESAALRATFFVTTGFIGSDRLLWFDQAALHWEGYGRERLWREVARTLDHDEAPATTLEEWIRLLKRLPHEIRVDLLDRLAEVRPCDDTRRRFSPMSWDHLRDLIERGHEIGSHTLSHPLLPQLPHPCLTDEIAASRTLLERQLGHHVRSFCYPNGDHDERVVDAVRSAGYRFACTTMRGQNRRDANPLLLSRMPITSLRVTSMSGGPSRIGFRAEISQYRSIIARFKQHIGAG